MIDIHTHIIPEHFPLAPRAACCGWPAMEHDVNGATIKIDDRPFRRLDARAWDVDARLAAMDAEHIDVHVLSPMPELLSYWIDADDAWALAHHVNATIAAMVKRAPARLMGLGTVPLQDIPRAVAGLQAMKDQHGLLGVEAGASVNGVPLGDPIFMPFLEKLQELDLALFVHPVRPLALPHAALPPELTAPLLGYPIDVGLSAVSFMVNDIAQRLPALRVAFAHGGGALPSFLPRLQKAWVQNARMGKILSKAPSELVRAFFYDTLVYEPANLRLLIAFAGLERVCLGSDEPFEIRQADPGACLTQIGLDATACRAIGDINPRRFLGLSVAHAH